MNTQETGLTDEVQRGNAFSGRMMAGFLANLKFPCQIPAELKRIGQLPPLFPRFGEEATERICQVCYHGLQFWIAFGSISACRLRSFVLLAFCSLKLQ